VIGWVREIRRDVQLGPNKSSVALFLVPARRERAKGVAPSCLEPKAKPTDLIKILPAPGFESIFANDSEGRLLRLERRAWVWVEVPLPRGTPPIEALLGFPLATSPLELVVAVRSHDQSELWTLVLANEEVTQAGPTDTSGLEYVDAVAFLRGHHTPWCREDDRDCLAVTRFDGSTFIDVALQRDAPSRQGLLELEGNGLMVADVAWGNAEGSEVLIAAAGSPCVH